MATYYDKAFALAAAEQRFDVVRPWWDLISQMTIQFSMIIALTSISLDVFSQFGSGIKCTPRNLPDSIGIQQYFYVNSACIENAVTFYVEYFGYVMFVQALLLIVVDNFWLNWSRTKNRLQVFNDMVELVNNSVVKRESINTTLRTVRGTDGLTSTIASKDELAAAMSAEEEKLNVAKELSALVSSKSQIKTEEAEEALRLNEKLRALFKENQESTLLAMTYTIKTVVRLALGLLFTVVALHSIVKGLFDFDFPCTLKMNSEETRSVPTNDYWCINVTATFSRMLVFFFLIVIVVNMIACVVALLGWNSVLEDMPRLLDDLEDPDEAVVLAEKKRIAASGAKYDVDAEKVHYEYDGRTSTASPNTNDVIFMLYLLRQTNEIVFQEVLDFASVDFHHELLEYLSNRRWPLEKLKSLLKPPPATQTLKIIDANLILIPPAVRHMSNLVEIDLSSNNHLFEISNLTGQKCLKYLKLRSCNLLAIDDLMGIQTLVRLDISDNKIARIPEEIVQLVNLAYLLVKYNRLRGLPMEVLKLPALNYLSIEGEHLEAIDPEHVQFENHPFIRGAFLRRISEQMPQEALSVSLEVTPPSEPVVAPSEPVVAPTEPVVAPTEQVVAPAIVDVVATPIVVEAKPVEAAVEPEVSATSPMAPKADAESLGDPPREAAEMREEAGEADA